MATWQGQKKKTGGEKLAKVLASQHLPSSFLLREREKETVAESHSFLQSKSQYGHEEESRPHTHIHFQGGPVFLAVRTKRKFQAYFTLYYYQHWRSITTQTGFFSCLPEREKKNASGWQEIASLLSVAACTEEEKTCDGIIVCLLAITVERIWRRNHSRCLFAKEGILQNKSKLRLLCDWSHHFVANMEYQSNVFEWRKYKCIK